MRIILASGSPRRKELLGKLVDSFEIISSNLDERLIEEQIEAKYKGKEMTMVADEMVKALSKAKAEDVFDNLGRPKDTLVIGSDTAVAVSDEIMGKPKDRNDAVRMLRKLSLEKQYVYTGVCIMSSEKTTVFSDVSMVYFNPLDDIQEEKIQKYCDTDEPYDKAGAYGIQLIGDEIVDHIEGSFDNIMGFPTEKIRIALKDFI